MTATELNTYEVEVYPYDGKTWEITAGSWVEACRIMLDDQRVAHVERISERSSIYACYRRAGDQCWSKVGCVRHVRTTGA